jgi:hypothetical protein
MRGGFTTNQDIVKRQRRFGKNDVRFTSGCNSRNGEANGVAHNTLKSEMNLKYV